VVRDLLYYLVVALISGIATASEYIVNLGIKNMIGSKVSQLLYHIAFLIYKFVELTVVTDESIESTVNEWVAQGWQFEGMHFAMAPTSKRPAMAFLSFTRDEPAPEPSSD
jgi:hypothetical protein